MVNTLHVHFVCLLFNYNIYRNANRNSLFPATTIDTWVIIKKIRVDFSVINSKLKSLKKKKKEVFVMYSEGGEVIEYYDKTFLIKAHSVFYGETGNVQTQYYFNKTGLFFNIKKNHFTTS